MSVNKSTKNYLIIFEDYSTSIALNKESIMKAIKSIISSKEIIEIKKLS